MLYSPDSCMYGTVKRSSSFRTSSFCTFLVFSMFQVMHCFWCNTSCWASENCLSNLLEIFYGIGSRGERLNPNFSFPHVIYWFNFHKTARWFSLSFLPFLSFLRRFITCKTVHLLLYVEAVEILLKPTCMPFFSSEPFFLSSTLLINRQLWYVFEHNTETY